MSTREICASMRLHRVPSRKIVCVISTRMYRMTVRKMRTEPLCRFNGVHGIMATHRRNALSHLRIHRIASKYTDAYGNASNVGGLQRIAENWVEKESAVCTPGSHFLLSHSSAVREKTFELNIERQLIRSTGQKQQGGLLFNVCYGLVGAPQSGLMAHPQTPWITAMPNNGVHKVISDMCTRYL